MSSLRATVNLTRHSAVCTTCYTVEPLSKDTSEMCIYLCVEDTLLCPKYAFLISEMRTHLYVHKGFHCIPQQLFS